MAASAATADRFLLGILPDAFGAPGLLWGLALALIPLIIFLLERRRAKTVDWPAMRFILADLRRAVRWMRLSELLLLASRTAALAGIAYALARPAAVEPAAASGYRAGAAAAVILLDNSFSMAWRMDPGGDSLWDRAQDAAIEALARHRDGDAVWVATLAGGARSASKDPIRSIEEARAAVRGAALEGGAADVLSGLDLAADLLAASPGPRGIYLFTDLQSSSWSLADEARWAFVLGRLRALSPPPALHAIAPGVNEPEPINHAILSLEVPRSVVGTDRSAEVLARAARFGPAGASSLKAALHADGLPLATQAVSVSSGAPAEVRFSHRFTAKGFHRLRLATDGDGLAIDDSRSLAVEVIDQVPVLIIAGGGDPGRFGGEGDLIELALAPRAGEETTPEVIFRVRSIEARELLASGALEAFTAPEAGPARGRVAVLANVPFLEQRAIELLERFVSEGGGLLVFAGWRADLQLYRSDLYHGGAGLLPAAPRERASAPGAAPVSPRAFRLEHSALAPFGEENRPDLEAIRIQRWLEMEPPPAGASTLAELPSGGPYIAERAFGRGRVILAATAANLEDSDLPRRPIFLPLLHGLASYLAASGRPQRDVPLGGAMRCDLGPGEAEAGARVAVEAPDGSLRALPVQSDGSGPYALETARQPGFYAFTIRAGGSEREELFAANLAPGESDLSRLDAEGMHRVSEVFGIGVHEAAAGIWGGAEETTRREHWPWILAVVLVCFAAEILLARSLARGRAPWQGPTAQARDFVERGARR